MSDRWFPGIEYPEWTDPHIPLLVDGFRTALELRSGECVIRGEDTRGTLSPRDELLLDVSHPALGEVIRIETGDGYDAFHILDEAAWWMSEQIATDLDWAVACIRTFEALLHGRNEIVARRRRRRYVGSAMRCWGPEGDAFPAVSLQKFRSPLLASLAGPDVSWSARRIELCSAEPIAVLA